MEDNKHNVNSYDTILHGRNIRVIMAHSVGDSRYSKIIYLISNGNYIAAYANNGRCVVIEEEISEIEAIKLMNLLNPNKNRDIKLKKLLGD